MPVDNILALERSSNAKKIRREGFIPGIIYGQDFESKSVQFDFLELNKLLKDNTKTSRFKVNIGNSSTRCIVKEVQRDSATGKLIHIDMQSISENEEIKIKVPITFTGKRMIESKNLMIENYLTELELSGKMKYMPEGIEIDVEDKEFGDKIIVSDIIIDSNLEVLDDKDEVVALVSSSKQQEIDEDETEEVLTPEE
ncbi:50S ribosomal protein L25 [Clostridium algidicarnis]|uniref:Large ribosomal subunit protein bL25 n=1 Tax=Clostridium algidicarnis TaxID=37659 RepID=A0ABS6C1S1_9CLOT|nr:50S ribosomal protein L25 [Clostridium algidicarnis]MBB6631320.1 50S ribosomal protein L25 [Clostridium algidicarnis]MBB6697203.1 50S ribosomal protein L25 [Clostridium algidicarnis]MBU3192378.1 50S ribosomal protein L25 [Clostridium algidicarnis]MBU3204474.1 50S ribosomal protein L25 [Clostridium algidicarnis]MBU3206398.1 50S ribosomal protein L25 [Clostridium algidicarnis]